MGRVCPWTRLSMPSCAGSPPRVFYFHYPVSQRSQADADFNYKIIRCLRRCDAAIDFQDALTGGIVGLPDTEVLAIAAAVGRILVSHDRRTMPAHFAQFLLTRPSPGLIILDQDLDIGRSIEELLLIWAATDVEEWEDKIGYVPI